MATPGSRRLWTITREKNIPQSDLFRSFGCLLSLACTWMKSRTQKEKKRSHFVLLWCGEYGVGGDKTVWLQRVVLPVIHQEVTSREARAGDLDLGGNRLGGSWSHAGGWDHSWALREWKWQREQHLWQTDTVGRKLLPSFYVTIACCDAHFPNWL